MNLNYKLLGIHIAVVVLFAIISVLYFKPVLQGEVIYQSDIVQYNGMAKERNDLKEETGHESYWTNSAFGGMPTYQLGANYSNNYIKSLDKVLRFLPRPADYVFLYLVSFYILMLVLKVDYRIAFLGAIAFGFSTYFIIILGVGHNAKAHAIAYFPLVVAGILLVFRKKYLWGTILSAVALSLEICANHPQMTYYLLLLILILGVIYLVDAIKKKEIPHFFKAVGLLLVAVVISILTNASNLLATQEYAKWSTRGKSDLTFNADGSEKDTSLSLDKEYITYYSYGVVESLDLLVPRLFGGASAEKLGKDSETYDYMVSQGYPLNVVKSISNSLPTYWGSQPGTAAPAYVGVIMVFLFILGIFLVKGKLKWTLVGGVIMSLFLSWGKNFGLLTDFMIDYFPLYDKFRAVSSIQVILELCIPILGIMGLAKFFNSEVSKEEKWNALKWSGIILGGLFVILYLGKSALFDFVGAYDVQMRQSYGKDIMNKIIEDRKILYTKDLIRSFLFTSASFFTLWLFFKEKLKKNIAVGVLIVLVAVDLIGVDTRYVNSDSFKDSKTMDTPFTETSADAEILKDTSDYRVFDLSQGLNGARASYFFNSIGGYHAAKPRRLQELYEYQIAKNNVEVLNMLNVKYLLRPDNNGNLSVSINPNANGSAWFVSNLKKVSSDDDAMKALDSLNTIEEAVVDTAIFSDLANEPDNFKVDSLANIELITKTPDYLKYSTTNKNNGFAVFSEMYYPEGWNVTIDSKEVPQYRVNYAFRGLEVPAGTHTIEFKFEPGIVKTGNAIMLGGNVLLLLLIIGGVAYQFKYRAKE
ncbi:membrane protein [Neptunitalea chrysea]|uniref:Membrane protein n=1 Tax=Neptunitalea chrysea TaxID=1647581 RepID=A0A9W6B6N9_9FLAO|nr:YfhO family protein [Neptunitalea chrysea]GLB53613.1 membrane protein [Neptunitalea chrysea]